MTSEAEPVSDIEPNTDREPAHGVGLCLSGGGYRAMLFHLGSLLRLCEIGYLGSTAIAAPLGQLERISSVSGGSITAAVCAQAWSKLRLAEAGAQERFHEHVVAPLRHIAGKTIDVGSVLTGLLPFTNAANRVAAAYRKHLFGDQTLEAFPEHPRFVINAANLQSGALWRFMRPYTRDWKVGEIPRERKHIEIAAAVSASSAFPPFLSPVRLKFRSEDYTPNSGGKRANNLHRPTYTTKPVLSDGGVYDNLGLETVWKKYRTVLVSDGGGAFAASERINGNWPVQSYRVLSVIDNQVRALRKRQVIGSYVAGNRTGAYWGIRTDIRNYGVSDPLPCPPEKTLRLAATPTRLKAMDKGLQDRLINWGYAVCDAAIRTHVDPSVPAPQDFPYPNAGVG